MSTSKLHHLLGIAATACRELAHKSGYTPRQVWIDRAELFEEIEDSIKIRKCDLAQTDNYDWHCNTHEVAFDGFGPNMTDPTSCPVGKALNLEKWDEYL